MARFIIAALLACVAAQDPPGVLRIDVVALDGRNEPVTDLKREDIEVWLNGRQIPIDSMTAVTPSTEGRSGRLFVLLLDDVTIQPVMVNRVRDAARRFVGRLQPGDRAAVAHLSGGLVEVTPDPSRVQRRIDSFNQSPAFLPIDRLGAHLLNTLAAISRDVSEAPERRKVIVAIGSGWLLDTPIPPPQLAADVRREWTDAVRALGTADVSYYALDPGGVGANRVSARGGFARDNGGYAFINTNDIDGAITRILTETDRYYELLIADPPFGRDAAIRELEVRPARKDITVRARRWIPGSVR